MISRFDNVTEFLLQGKEPGRCALEFLHENVTYGDLQNGADRIARSLLEMAARKGDRVILAADNSPFWTIAYLGIMRAGLVCVPLTAGVAAADLSHILQVTEARMVFAQRSLVSKNGAALGAVHLVTDKPAQPVSAALSQQTMTDLLENPAASETAFPATGPDDLAALMFTSGSTGQPRGVMISHANIIANTRSIIEYLELTADDRIMAVLPFHYCFGTSLLHTHLRAGGTLVVDPRFLYPETVLQRMMDARCTGFAGVPSHFQILLNASGLRNKPLPHLRYVQQAGGHLAPSFIRELRDALPATHIYIMYGQTEATARLSYLPPGFLNTKAGSIGRGIPGVELRVLDESGVPVLPGQIGEIVARGDNIALGYWNAPYDTENTFRNGALFTGDLATVDDDGFIYVVDRAKDFVKCGGERVSCRQIEDQLLAFDELLEAAVIGVPDDVLGESVKAFVVPRSGMIPTGLSERLHRFCKDRMPPRLVPRDIVVLGTLPKSPAGKVLKATLKILS
jgi:long-chain acyl-CoA synthetase